MKLCTFEVQTPVARPCELADVLVPDNMLDFLRGGKTAMEAAAEALDSLRKDPKPGTPEIGTKGETLVYPEGNVRLLAPLPNPASLRDFYAFEEHVKKGFEKRA